MTAPVSPESPAAPAAPAGRAGRRRQQPTRRVAALVGVGIGVLGVVAAGLAVERRGESDESVTVDDGATATTIVDDPDALSPVAPGPDAAGSTWYCAAGTASSGGFADHTIVIANPGEVPITVEVTVFGGSDDVSAAVAAPVARTLDVPGRGTAAMRLADVLDSPFAAALVEAGPGEIVVEHGVAGTSDGGVAPCATVPSAAWHVAAGATTRDARELLALFNPFPDDVIVDVTFTTPEGVRSPPEFDGFVIPGQRVIAIDVGAVVSRHSQVSASIVARTGRLVVERLQSFDGTDGPAGLALTPAAPAPALVWTLPDGRYVDGVSEVVTVYNPTDATTEVDVEVTLAPSDDPALDIGVEPFRLTIAARSFAQVDLAAAPDRVPPDLGHSTTVRSQNDVPVVAERWVRSGSPAPTVGLAATLGSPVVATRWLLAVGGTTGGQTEFLVITNASTDTIARVSVTAPTPTQEPAIAGLEDVEVPVGGRVALDIGQYTNRTGLALVVDSTRPVVVERGLYVAGGGFSHSIAVPSGPTAAVAVVDTELSG
jgi:hypothetical protein